MDCTWIQENLDGYLFGAMGTEDRERFDAHLVQCSACRKAVALQESVHQALLAGPVDIPDGLVDAVMDRVRRAGADRRMAPVVWRWAVAAMLVVSLVGGMLIFQLTDLQAAPVKVAQALDLDRSRLSRDSMKEHLGAAKSIEITQVRGATAEMVTDIAEQSWAAVRGFKLPFGTIGLVGLILVGLAACVLNMLFLGGALRRDRKLQDNNGGKGPPAAGGMIRKVTSLIIVAVFFLLLAADTAYADNLSDQDKINAVFTLSVGGAILVTILVIALGILAFQLLFLTAFPAYSQRLSAAARRMPGRAVLLGLVNLLFLFLCFAVTSEKAPFLAGLFFIAFVLVVSIGLMGQARNLGRSILRKEGDNGSDIGAVAVGFFVIVFLNVIPIFGFLFTLYNVFAGAGAFVLAFAKRGSKPIQS